MAIVFFFAIVTIIKVISDNRTRQKLIEKRLLEENIKYLYPDRLEHYVSSSLKWGMVLVGIGLAIFIGQMVPQRISDVITAAGIFIFAGLGLILYYVIATLMVKKSEKEDNARE